MGAGPWSPTIRVNTRPRPPSPPHLECIVKTHNSLKLRWGEGRSNALLLYKLEMENKSGYVGLRGKDEREGGKEGREEGRKEASKQAHSIPEVGMS